MIILLLRGWCPFNLNSLSLYKLAYRVLRRLCHGTFLMFDYHRNRKHRVLVHNLEYVILFAIYDFFIFYRDANIFKILQLCAHVAASSGFYNIHNLFLGRVDLGYDLAGLPDELFFGEFHEMVYLQGVRL